jgi:hypothetical protein
MNLKMLNVFITYKLVLVTKKNLRPSSSNDSNFTSSKGIMCCLLYCNKIHTKTLTFNIKTLKGLL